MTYLATMALLLTATLAGCGREPLPQAGNTIRFSVAADYGLSVGTKAELVDLAGMQGGTLGAIKLYGSMAGVTTPVFDGASLSYADSKWSYGSVKYWIQNGVYDFRAVFLSTTASVTAGSSAEVKVNYSMASDNYDLMVASKTAVSANTQAASGNPDVELAFQHACTAVRFLFKESDNNNDYYLKSMTLQGVNTSGTMTYNSTLAWSDYGTTAASLWSDSWKIAPTATEEYTGPGDGWHILPPQTSLDNAKLVVTYTVGNADGAQILPVTIPLKYVDATDSGKSVTSWDRAKTYTYKIELQANAIEFTVTKVDWTVGSNFDYSGNNED